MEQKQTDEWVIIKKTGDSKAKKVFRHLLKYGGLYLIGLSMYVLMFWLAPLAMSEGKLISVGISHLIFTIVVWAGYGVIGTDEDVY